MRLSLSFTVLLASLTSVLAAAGSEVVDLTGTNFESVVNPADLILVEFFAPWYVHRTVRSVLYSSVLCQVRPLQEPRARVRRGCPRPQDEEHLARKGRLC